MRLAQLFFDQDGVVARWQVLAAGYDDAFIERMLRRREWARVHPGVYLEHTGRPTWQQRAWAAVLHYWPAALSHSSALGPPGTPRRGREAQPVIHVAIEHPRKAVAVPGVHVHRLVGLHGRVR
ncbi:MAG: type IV toxin-antitoxin system AbiEi family antitoxin domain-containing protein [Nocardioidaceae bacterium]